MESFTPISSFLGGALIGSSSALLLALNGKIAGISGIAGGLVDGARDRQWRFAFVLGLVLRNMKATLLFSLVAIPFLALYWLVKLS